MRMFERSGRKRQRAGAARRSRSEMRAVRPRQARVDLEAHRLLARILEGHLRIDALADAQLRAFGHGAGHVAASARTSRVAMRLP